MLRKKSDWAVIPVLLAEHTCMPKGWPVNNFGILIDVLVRFISPRKPPALPEDWQNLIIPQSNKPNRDRYRDRYRNRNGQEVGGADSIPIPIPIAISIIVMETWADTWSTHLELT